MADPVLRRGVRRLRAWAIRWRARLSARRRGVVLVYHSIGERAGDRTVEIIPTVAAAALRQELAHLKRCYHVVPARRILEASARRRRFQRFPVAVTFDDDLDAHPRHALPELSRAGVQATFFLSGASLDGPAPFWWEDLQVAVDQRLIEAHELTPLDPQEVDAALSSAPGAAARLAAAVERLEPAVRAEIARRLRRVVGDRGSPGLRRAEIERLTSVGHEIGFHTIRHDVLPPLDDSALAAALVNGRERLEASAGRVDLIAYPHGKADSRVAAAAREAGYVLGFTGAPQPVEPDVDPLRVPRLEAAPQLSNFALELARAVARSRQGVLPASTVGKLVVAPILRR